MRVKLRNPDREVEVAGGRKVRQVLRELGIDPDTVLVIRDGALLTREDVVGEEDVLEIRPVISGGGHGSGMKCRRCRRPAVVELRRHNAAFCRDCFLHHVREQVKRAIAAHDMLRPGDRVLVAVSGGKDSLGLWDLLLDLGYRASGLYLGLGIGGYSDRSAEAVRVFAEGRRDLLAERGAGLVEVDLREAYGFDVTTARARGSRATCATCGLSKRYVFNRVALEGGFDVLATGHNLDDEAANLLGNLLRWQTEFLARQSPVLPARPGMVKKVKPLYRLTELETAAYAFLRGIEYVVEECPLVAGNTQLRYKEAMNRLEATSPGTKAQFLLGFLDKVAPRFRPDGAAELAPCEACGQPTTGRFCAFCRARAQVLGLRLGETREPAAVEVAGGPGPPGAAGGRGDDGQVARELAEEVLPVEPYGAATGRAS